MLHPSCMHLQGILCVCAKLTDIHLYCQEWIAASIICCVQLQRTLILPILWACAESVAERSEAVNSKLQLRREQIEELSQVKNLLTKLQAVFDLPRRLRTALDRGALEIAADAYADAAPLLKRYGHKVRTPVPPVLLLISLARIWSPNQQISLLFRAPCKIALQMKVSVEHLLPWIQRHAAVFMSASHAAEYTLTLETLSSSCVLMHMKNR